VIGVSPKHIVLLLISIPTSLLPVHSELDGIVFTLQPSPIHPLQWISDDPTI